MAAHSSILAQRISQTEEPGQLQSMGQEELDTTEKLNQHLRPVTWRSFLCFQRKVSR